MNKQFQSVLLGRIEFNWKRIWKLICQTDLFNYKQSHYWNLLRFLEILHHYYCVGKEILITFSVAGIRMTMACFQVLGKSWMFEHNLRSFFVMTIWISLLPTAFSCFSLLVIEVCEFNLESFDPCLSVKCVNVYNNLWK